VLNERFAEIDRELSSFEVSEQRISDALAEARALRSDLGPLEALDATLDALAEGLVLAEATSDDGARATTWEEARRAALSELSSEGSGVLDVSDEALESIELPAVLSVGPNAIEPGPTGAADDDEREPISAATAAYIDPPSLPPTSTATATVSTATQSDAFSLDLDPEAGLVEPGAAPLSYLPPPKPVRPSTAPRPSSAPQTSTEDMLAEMLDGVESEKPPPPPAPSDPLPSVAEDEASDALAAMQRDMPPAALNREAVDAFEASLSYPSFEVAGLDVRSADIGDEEEEHTVMMKASALLPPAPGDIEYADGVPSAEFELDFDDEMIEIEEMPEESDRSPPPPPPPPSRPPETSRSRPPEPPGQGFLSRLLKGNKS